jgi:hypothetical protein
VRADPERNGPADNQGERAEHASKDTNKKKKNSSTHIGFHFEVKGLVVGVGVPDDNERCCSSVISSFVEAQ